MAAAFAATLAAVPIVHVHGGEETEGAFDDVLARSVHPCHRQPVPAHSSPVRHAVDALPLQAKLPAHDLDQLAASVQVHGPRFSIPR